MDAAGAATPRPLRLAHRGDHRRAPENTLGAFRAALAIPGCDGLEFDVRLSRDGVPIVIHDHTLDRVHGRPARADELSADELGNDGVLTLEQVLAAVPADAFLDVELKIDTGRATLRDLEAARGPRLDRAVVSSFDVAALETVRAAQPDWPCWLNALQLGPEAVELALRLGCRGISADWRTIDERSLRLATDHGFELAAWTVTRRPTFARLARLGVTAVCLEGPALDG
jgi:glycerophosphoryl diester phosphodiesterase